MRSLRDKRSCAIAIDSIIYDEQLKQKWTYSNSNYSDAEINRITQTYLAKLQNLIQYCLTKDSGGYTASDFTTITSGSYPVSSDILIVDSLGIK